MLRRVPPFQFLSNHGLVLLAIATDPSARMRDLAASVGITERATQRIVADLISAGYVGRERDGRRNRYAVSADRSFTLPSQRAIDLGALLGVLLPPGAGGGRPGLPGRALVER